MRTIKIPRPRIEAALAPQTADSEQRTVEVTFYTGAEIPRFSWSRGDYTLTFSMKPGACRLGALNSGTAPVLESHSEYSTRDVLGVVEKAWLKDGEARAMLRFAKNDPEIDQVWNKIEQKILRNVSMGVVIHKMQETSKQDDKIKSFLALDWEPIEISAVPRGADPGAHMHMAATLGDEVEVNLDEEDREILRATSPEEQLMPVSITETGEKAQVNVDDVKLAAQTAERTRVLEITKLGSKHGLAQLAAEHVASGTSIEQFRVTLLDALAARDAEQPSIGHHAEVTRDQRDTFRLGAAQSILFRQNPAAHPLKSTDAGYDYRGFSTLLRLAEECVRLDGRNPGRMSPNEIARLAMSTSDFPLILADSANKSLRAGYDKMPSQWKQLGARRTAPNFKPQYELAAGMTATFPQVKESGEYQEATMTEGRETWRVYTYGNKLSFTRQTIINDDLNALTNVPEGMGMKAAMRQADLFWAVLKANAALADGQNLFSAAHSNIVTGPGTAIAVASLGIVVAKLMVQTDLSGDVIGLVPKYLAVPPALRQIARQYMSNAFQPTAQSGINPEAGTMTVIEEPRLAAASAGGSDTSWYVFADPGVAPVLIYATLSGEEGIYSEVAERTDPDVTQWLARFDFGAGAIDSRGAVKNDGV